MTTQEFSNEFDTLLSSYNNSVQFGNTDNMAFDEYEKSVFLTKAQEDIVISLYNGKNPFGEAFENTEEIRRYLDSLVKTVKLNPNDYLTEDNISISDTSYMFNLPQDLLFVIYEGVDIDTGNCGVQQSVQVYPVKHDQLHRIKRNPFRGVSDSRVLRLDAGNNVIELISNYTINKYTIRYLSKPSPIILQDLKDNLAIDSISTETQCKLHVSLHRPILEKAVKMAILSKSMSINNQQVNN